MRRRLPVLLVLVLACTVAPASPVERSSSVEGSSSVELVETTPVPGIDVLHAWDRRRAHAYATADTAALRALYVRGSRAGEGDVRLLGEYERRGYRVVGMRMQVLALAVLERRPGVLRLRVTDRLYDAAAVRRGVRVPLPCDQATTREVRLVRAHDRAWRVRAVTAQVIGGVLPRAAP